MQSYVTLDGWKSNVRFSSAHIIHEYEKCGRIHGHTYAIHTKIKGEPDEKGIIMDFSIIKDILRNVASDLDHRILIPEKSKIAKIEKTKDSVKIDSLGKTYIFPITDCVLLPIISTSAENLAEYIIKKVIKNVSFPKGIKSIEIGVDEGFGQGARISKTL